MKKILITFSFMVGFESSYACDVCGNSSSSFFNGSLPQYNRHFVSLRFGDLNYRSISSENPTEYSKDSYKTYDLSLGVRVGKKLHATVILPYKSNMMNTNEGIKTERGIGDMTMVMNYRIFVHRKNVRPNEAIEQKFYLGGGVKMPTGKFTIDENEPNTSANLQTGTGSLDFILSGAYLRKSKYWEIGIVGAYKMNQSSHDYQFGNKSSVVCNLARKIKLTHFDLIPNAGAYFERFESDYFKGEKVDHTDGQSVMLTAGSQILLGKFSFAFSYQVPVWQHYAHGQTTMNNRSILQLNYQFN